MSDHPSLDRLFDAARGRPEAADAAHHAAACPSCARSLAWLVSVLDASNLGYLPEPPDDWIEAALRIPDEAPAVERREPSWTPARLLSDAVGALAGVRGAGEARRYVYEAGEAHLDLEITADDEDAGLLRVTGQILVPGMERAQDAIATLWSGEVLAAHSAADTSGVFAFPAVEPGTYRLDVWPTGAGRAIRVQPLVLEED